jgi:hypothetical protein
MAKLRTKQVRRLQKRAAPLERIVAKCHFSKHIEARLLDAAADVINEISSCIEEEAELYAEKKKAKWLIPDESPLLTPDESPNAAHRTGSAPAQSPTGQGEAAGEGTAS